jgi:hypothetical protein
VRYTEHKTFRAGLASHYRWLRHMGQEEPLLGNSALTEEQEEKTMV